MTHWSLFHHTVKGVAVVFALLLLLGTTACDPTTVAKPAVSTSKPTAAVRTTAAPTAPTAQNEPSTDVPCSLITEEAATKALGFDPGRSHIDTSGVIDYKDKACAWGEPKSFDPPPFIAASAHQFPTSSAAQAAFNTDRARMHNAFSDPSMAIDATIGCGAVILPSDGGASAIVCGKKWEVTINFIRKDRTAQQAQGIVTELSRIVVSRLP